jgi:pyridoxamine-phosphate oxidase
MKKEISALRENYTLSKLGRADLSTDPMDQFRKWFDDALSAEILEPNAMVLATLNKDNYPSSRVVLIKEIENDGIIFYTNYRSQKAQDIENNPKVSVTFLWKEIQRQVRVEGIVTKVSREQSANYFNKRPRASQIGAWTSVQSSIIDSREELEKRKAEIEEKYKDSETIPLPLDWGGYKITATAYEFWQGRRSRLHDRFRYEKGGDESWEIFRLSP